MTSKARQLADLGGDTANLEDVSSAYGSGALGNRNLIINGAFQVSQRGDYTSATSAVSSIYYLDRWYADLSGVATTIQQTTGNDINGMPAVSKAAKIAATASSGSAYFGIRQKIENPSQYEGRTFTYSAYVKSNSTNARIGTFIDGATDLQFVSAGHSGNGQWERLSITFTITNSSVGTWYLDAFIISNTYDFIPVTSGEYIEITGVQLEVGSVATPFEHRSFGQELALCQRYFCRNGVSTNHYYALQYTANFKFFQIQYPVQMRAAPSVSFSVSGGSWTTYLHDDVHWKAYGASSYTDAATYSLGSYSFDAEL